VASRQRRRDPAERGAPQAKLYDKNLLPADMDDEQQRARHWAETHDLSHEQVHAQRQHVLEEQQHISGQGGHAAPGDHPHGGAPQAKLYDKNLLPADMRDERQRAHDWAETHGHSHKQVHAQRQHVLEEQQHIAGQGGHAAPDYHPHGRAPQAKLYDKNLLPTDMDDEQQRAHDWAETHGHSHKQVHAQRQHVLEQPLSPPPSSRSTKSADVFYNDDAPPRPPVEELIAQGDEILVPSDTSLEHAIASVNALGAASPPCRIAIEAGDYHCEDVIEVTAPQVAIRGLPKTNPVTEKMVHATVHGIWRFMKGSGVAPPPPWRVAARHSL